MHDLRLVRERLDVLRDAMARRNMADATAAVLDRVEGLEGERRTAIRAVEEKKAERNVITQQVSQKKRAGEEAGALIEQSRVLGDEIARLELSQEAADQELHTLLLQLPNITLSDVPAGGEENNAMLRTWGAPRAADSVKPHWDVGAALGILDLERGVKVSGSGFIVFRSKGARLVRALMNFMLDVHTREHGYEELWVPSLVNHDAMIGTGQFPKFEDEQYALRDDPLYLIPTAEVPVTNLYHDEVVAESDLPRGFCAYTPCFRREAGSHGKDTRGLLRVHQFDKVELVRYATPESADAEHAVIVGHAERILQLLELPYRVLVLAAGDTGFASARTYDLEVFAPGVGKWLEVSSASLFTDFQARRANIRYRPAEGGKPRLIHTLNASGVAFPRVIASILEHHQNADGTVRIPTALQPYFGSAIIE